MRKTFYITVEKTKLQELSGFQLALIGSGWVFMFFLIAGIVSSWL